MKKITLSFLVVMLVLSLTLSFVSADNSEYKGAFKVEGNSLYINANNSVIRFFDNSAYIQISEMYNFVEGLSAADPDHDYMFIEPAFPEYIGGVIKSAEGTTYPNQHCNIGISSMESYRHTLYVPIRNYSNFIGFKVYWLNDTREIKLQYDTSAEMLDNEGYPRYNVMMEYINTDVYEKYGIVSFGQQFGDIDVNGEYQYLGYSHDQLELINPMYIDSAVNSNSNDFQADQLKEYNWKKISGPDSLMFISSMDSLMHIKNSKVIYKGMQLDLTLYDILSNYEEASSYFRIVNIPSKVAYGVVYMKHEVNGEVITEVFLLPKRD